MGGNLVVSGGHTPALCVVPHFAFPSFDDVISHGFLPHVFVIGFVPFQYC